MGSTLLDTDCGELVAQPWSSVDSLDCQVIFGDQGNSFVENRSMVQADGARANNQNGDANSHPLCNNFESLSVLDDGKCGQQGGADSCSPSSLVINSSYSNGSMDDSRKGYFSSSSEDVAEDLMFAQKSLTVSSRSTPGSEGVPSTMNCCQSFQNDSSSLNGCQSTHWSDSSLCFSAGVSESPGSFTHAKATAGTAVNTPEVGRSISRGFKNSTSEESISERGKQKCSDEDAAVGNTKGKAGNGRRKLKVEWTPELHRKFVEAVEFLGIEKAIPSRILELMDVQCLTRHNIASHLQKYRSHHRHLLAREAEAASWPHRKEGSTLYNTSHSGHPPIQPRPALGHPSAPPPVAPVGIVHHPHQPSPAVGMPLYVWGHPSQSMHMDQSQGHYWQQTVQNQAQHLMGTPAPWYGGEGWRYPGSSPVPHIDQWGVHPPTAVQGTPLYPQLQHATGTPAVSQSVEMTSKSGHVSEGTAVADDIFSEDPFSTSCEDFGFSVDPKEEVFNFGDESSFSVDDFLNEALANPEHSPPIGLKLSAVDSVVFELEKQGISSSSAEDLAVSDMAPSLQDDAFMSCLTDEVTELNGLMF